MRKWPKLWGGRKRGTEACARNRSLARGSRPAPDSSAPCVVSVILGTLRLALRTAARSSRVSGVHVPGKKVRSEAAYCGVLWIPAESWTILSSSFMSFTSSLWFFYFWSFGEDRDGMCHPGPLCWLPRVPRLPTLLLWVPGVATASALPRAPLAGPLCQGADSIPVGGTRPPLACRL